MEETIKTEDAKVLELTPEEEIKKHNEIVDAVINNVKENKFKLVFYCPALNSPSGGMGLLFGLAKTLKENGFDILMAYEPQVNQKATYDESMRQKKQVQIYDKFKPEWLDFNIDDLEIVPLGDKKITFADKTTQDCTQLSLRPEDFLIIPEGFANIMKKVQGVMCQKIVLCQSWFYILNSLNTGEIWAHYNMIDVISVSDAITEYLNIIMPGMRIKSFSQSINRNLFKVPTKKIEKSPVIGFMGTRGQENRMKTFNIIKTFQAFYPNFRWFRFVELSGLSKKDFAERLASCAIVLYTDDIAGFGTLPLEAMACGTHVVGWTPYGAKEYVTKENGFWATNGDIFQTAELLGDAVDKWLNGVLDNPEIQEVYEKTLDRYTQDKEKESILKIFDEYKNQRIEELTKIKK